MPKLLKLVALIAVLLMPLGMQPASAAPAQHLVSMPMEHCPEQGPKHSNRAGFMECAMACSAALPASEFASEQPMPIVCAPTESEAAQILHGLHPDTATPPPKRS